MTTSKLELLETLIKEKEVEIADGVLLKCGDEVNITLFRSGDEVVLKFGSPAVQVFITKMGPVKLINALRPTLESITIGDTIKVSVDNAPDIEISREGL
jgi:hypothetical protein